MKLYKLFLGFLVIFIFSTLALAVTTDKSAYTLGETVKISGSCASAGISVGLQAGMGLNTVWVNELTTDNNKQYTASFLPAKTGTYILYAACSGDGAVTTSFCVGSNCGGGITPTDTSSSSSSSYSSSGGPYGSPCLSNITCTPWEKGYCNASLIKTRECIDLKGCISKYTETKNCTTCDESWVCQQLSSCQNGQQTRACADEHKCGTVKLKPALTKKCEVVAALPVAGKTAPPKAGAKIGELEVSEEVKSSFWEDYKYYLLGGVAFIVLLFVVLVVMLLLHRHRRVTYNVDELKNWMMKERQAGTSDADIIKILQEYTKWTAEEITGVLKSLGVQK